MRVCIIVEGAYPYVMGGVASWIQDNIRAFADVEFIVQTLVVDRKEKKTFAYEIPDNVLEVREAYLQDEDYFSENDKLKIPKNVKKALESLFFGENVQWETLFHFFQDNNFRLNDLLSSPEFLDISIKYYLENYSQEIFSDFLWTMRSIFLPLFSIMKTKLPEADMYHVFSTGYAGILGSMAKVLYNKPFLLSEHGIYTREREEEIIRASWVKGIYKDLWIQTFKKYSTCSYYYADKVTALFKDATQFQIALGCDKNKIKVIRNGIDVTKYKDAPLKDPDDPYINVGAILRVTQIKDVKTLISAFTAAKKIVPELKLWIMGPEGEDRVYVEECKELVRLYQVEDIIFTGRIQVKEYVGKMDFLVLTSISEGQPLVILEGFSVKKPYICTNVGNCAGMLKGEEDDYGMAGIICPVMGIEQIKSAIVYLATHKEEREHMGEVGYRRTAEFYRIDDVHREYVKLYEKYGGGK